jgi:glycosyltransferase involved in cell wall biosynthesis
MSLVTYERGAGAGETNNFIIAAREQGIPLDMVTERGRYDPSVFRQIAAIIEKRQPDIILTHNVKTHFLMRASGLWQKHRWLAFQHGYTATDFKMQCYNQLDRWSLRAPDRVVTVCEAFAQKLVARGIAREHIAVLHNAVLPFRPADSTSLETLRGQLPEGVPLLVCIGRLSFEKGQADLLRALDFLRRKLGEERFHLVLVGDGPEQTRLEALRAELGLQGHVTLAGLQHDVRPYYTAADLVVIPSHSEGSPNVLLEAMAANVPVVATRVGGIPEIAVDGETALLVEPRDPEAMARAIRRMLGDPGLRAELTRKGRRLADEKHSLEAYGRALTGIFQNVLANPRHRSNK